MFFPDHYRLQEIQARAEQGPTQVLSSKIGKTKCCFPLQNENRVEVGLMSNRVKILQGFGSLKPY